MEVFRCANQGLSSKSSARDAETCTSRRDRQGRVRRLDLDHIGAQVAQHLGGDRADQRPGEIQHAHAGQRTAARGGRRVPAVSRCHRASLRPAAAPVARTATARAGHHACSRSRARPDADRASTSAGDSTTQALMPRRRPSPRISARVRVLKKAAMACSHVRAGGRHRASSGCSAASRRRAADCAGPPRPSSPTSPGWPAHRSARSSASGSTSRRPAARCSARWPAVVQRAAHAMQLAPVELPHQHAIDVAAEGHFLDGHIHVLPVAAVAARDSAPPWRRPPPPSRRGRCRRRALPSPGRDPARRSAAARRPWRTPPVHRPASARAGRRCRRGSPRHAPAPDSTVRAARAPRPRSASTLEALVLDQEVRCRHARRVGRSVRICAPSDARNWPSGRSAMSPSAITRLPCKRHSWPHLPAELWRFRPAAPSSACQLAAVSTRAGRPADCKRQRWPAHARPATSSSRVSHRITAAARAWRACATIHCARSRNARGAADVAMQMPRQCEEWRFTRGLQRRTQPKQAVHVGFSDNAGSAPTRWPVQPLVGRHAARQQHARTVRRTIAGAGARGFAPCPGRGIAQQRRPRQTLVASLRRLSSRLP